MSDDRDGECWRDAIVGRFVGYDEHGRKVWRQFCARCGCPILATEPYKDDPSRTCDDCTSPSGNAIPSTAFSPDRRLAD